MLLDQAREEFVAALPHLGPGELRDAWLPRKQLSRERMADYHRLLEQLVEDFLSEASDPAGEAYTLFALAFRAPPYAQPHPDAGAERSEPGA